MGRSQERDHLYVTFNPDELFSRDRELGGPTPEHARQSRARFTEIDAHEFRSAYDRHRERECSERKIQPGQDRSHWLWASVDRVALSRALIERGYLLIRSRRVTPPITLRYADRIS